MFTGATMVAPVLGKIMWREHDARSVCGS